MVWIRFVFGPVERPLIDCLLVENTLRKQVERTDQSIHGTLEKTDLHQESLQRMQGEHLRCQRVISIYSAFNAPKNKVTTFRSKIMTFFFQIISN